VGGSDKSQLMCCVCVRVCVVDNPASSIRWVVQSDHRVADVKSHSEKKS